MGELAFDNTIDLNEQIFTTLHFKDLSELSKFIEGYKEPIQAQMESLKYLV